jgi:hypothetical protein
MTSGSAAAYTAQHLKEQHTIHLSTEQLTLRSYKLIRRNRLEQRSIDSGRSRCFIGIWLIVT